MAICTGIRIVERTATSGDLLEVTIDNEIKALWFYPEQDAQKYLNQEVIVDFRRDIYNGNMQQFVKTFAIPTVIHTLERDDNIKLLVDSVDNKSNVVFSELSEGDTLQGAVVFCTEQSFDSSDRAIWMKLTIRDSAMKTATLRIFDYENKSADLAGHYIVTTLNRSKYGFQTHEAKPLNGDGYVNPEIEIAKNYIHRYFSNDVVANDYMVKLNLLEVLEEHVDYEIGYGLMRLAMELDIAASLRNLSNDFNLEAVGHILLCSRGYLSRSSALSPTFNNVLLASQYLWPQRRIITECLDESLEEHPKEYDIVKKIKEMVSTILEIRKGTDPRR